MKNRVKNRESGSVTVEATIALTAFIFVFVCLYSIITLCRAQANIQVAINSAAREISQYSYLYGMTGFDKTMTELENEAADEKAKANEFIDTVSDVYGEISNLANEAVNLDSSSWSTIGDKVGEVEQTKEDITKLWQTIQGAASNPMDILFGLGRIMAADGWELAKSMLIAAPISRMITQKHLRLSEKMDAEAFCKSVGIVPGTDIFNNMSYFNGLDFSHSQLFPTDHPDEIIIVVTYKIKILQVLPIKSEFEITQMAHTRGWLHGDGTSLDKE